MIIGCKVVEYFQEDGFYCSITGDRCMFSFPNSRQCGDTFGEGPDAQEDDGSEQE